MATIYEKMTAIANAVRIKTGRTDTLTLDEMVSSLNDIPERSSADLTVSGTTVSVPAGNYKTEASKSVVIVTQTKSIAPIESEQTVMPDVGYDGLSSVTVGAIPSTYIGSSVTRKSAATYTPTESEQTISAGQYLDGAQTISAIPSTYVGSGVPTQGAKTVTPSTSIQTAVASGTYVTGDIQVAAMPIGMLSTPTINISTGVVTTGVSTAGYLGTDAAKTLQLNTKSAATIIPSTTDQTIAAEQYLTGIQTIKGDSNLVAENIASGVSIFGVTGTHSSIDTSDATATDADIISGKTAYINGSKVTGTLVVQNYYTGTTAPESSLGNNGDLYFKV